jgi:TonB family protein
VRIIWMLAVFFCSALPLPAEHSIAYMDTSDNPWTKELVKTEAPAYPEVAKRWHVQGAGLYRITVDPSTGRVVNVAIVKSTGFGVLDASAMRALRAWRWRPGTKLRQVNIPIRFTLNQANPFKVPAGTTRLSPSPY